jgi:hypothetical protein
MKAILGAWGIGGDIRRQISRQISISNIGQEARLVGEILAKILERDTTKTSSTTQGFTLAVASAKLRYSYDELLGHVPVPIQSLAY